MGKGDDARRRGARKRAAADADRSEESAVRHEPKQLRGVETRNALLDAAADVFADHGYEGSTTHQVAARAGVSVGALYRYFSDKEALLVETYRREMSALRERILREFGVVQLVGKDVGELARMAMELAFQVFSERPTLRRVLVEQSRRVPALAELRRSQERETRETVGQILRAVPGVRLPDLDVGAYLVSLFMESLIDDLTLYPSEDRVFDERRVIDGAVDFILSYVMGARDVRRGD